MMQEKVCIVLNERESAKAKAASELEMKLQGKGITVSRIEIDQHIEQVILERSPKILLLDYLIGDYTTGLDILQAINDKDGKKPQVIFFTDEPSVRVAVEALQLGAVSYIELDDPQGVNNIIRLCQELLDTKGHACRPAKEKTLPLNELIAESDAAETALRQAQRLCIHSKPIIAVYGKRGSGISTFARCILYEKRSSAFRMKIDLKTFDQDFRQHLGIGQVSDRMLKLGQNMSLLVEHAEEDNGELLDLIAGHYEDIWKSQEGVSYLIISTDSEETLACWEKLVPLDKLAIPALSERRADFPALIQRFVREASEYAKEPIRPFESEVFSWLASLEWPGEIKQLRAVVIDAVISSTFSSKDIKELIEEARQRWLEDHNSSCQVESLIDPYTAALTLSVSGYSYRVASAKLGCSISALRALIYQGKENPVESKEL